MVAVGMGISVGGAAVGVSVAGRGVSDGGGAEDVSISSMAFCTPAVADSCADTVPATWVATVSSLEILPPQAVMAVPKIIKNNKNFFDILFLL